MMELIKLFRFETIDNNHGMWFDHKGRPLNKIEILCPYSEARFAPMPIDLDIYNKDGKKWHSSCSTEDMLRSWFTAGDAINLIDNGYQFFELLVNEVQTLKNEILFTKESIVKKRIKHIDEVWDI